MRRVRNAFYKNGTQILKRSRKKIECVKEKKEQKKKKNRKDILTYRQTCDVSIIINIAGVVTFYEACIHAWPIKWQQATQLNQQELKRVLRYSQKHTDTVSVHFDANPTTKIIKAAKRS